jgi:hypothetical protein
MRCIGCWMTTKRLFKVRVQNISFQDLVVKAENPTAAKVLALKMYESPGNGEFVEFLPVEEEDKGGMIYGN